MSVAKIVKAFDLVPFAESQLRKVYIGSNRSQFDTLLNGLETFPKLREQFREELLALVASLLPSEKPVEKPEESTACPPVPGKPSTACPPVPGNVKPAQAIAWILVGDKPSPYTGQPIPAGAKVCFEGGSGWVDYVAPESTACPPVPGNVKPVDTVVNYPDSAIPTAHSGKGKIPWALNVSYSAKHDQVYCLFGLPVFKGHMKCSVPAADLLESLSDENVKLIRRFLAESIAKVKPVN